MEYQFNSYTNNIALWDTDSLYVSKAESVSSGSDETDYPGTPCEDSTPFKDKYSSCAFLMKEDHEDYHGLKKDVKFLSDRQKRANHIASEQKRRNSIRDGFKEMQDMVPGLLKSHHSKSTILFKAVHYIRRLDRRNQSLREKLLRLREKQAGKISYDSISIPMTEDIPHTPPPLLKFASIVNIHTSHSPDAMVIPAFETWSIPPTRLDEHLLSLKRKQSIFQ